MITRHEIAASIAEQLSTTAEWRREKAEEYGDDRCTEAASICENLAGQFLAGDYQDDLLDRYISACADDNAAYFIAEAENELKGEIGFHYWPSTADEFLMSVLSSGRYTDLRSVAA